VTNGKRAGNACSDCYQEPTSSELDLYAACFLLVASGHPQSQHFQCSSFLELVRRADPHPNTVNQPVVELRQETYDISAMVGDGRKCRNVEEARVEGDQGTKVSSLEAVTLVFANCAHEDPTMVAIFRCHNAIGGA